MDKRAIVLAAFRHAMRQKSMMANMRGRDKTFTGRKHTYTGVDADTTDLNPLMPQELNIQVGCGKYPRVFHNFPYLETHPDPTLAGKTPIPTSHTNMPVMYEYPIKPGTSFLGSGAPGPARVVVSDNEFHGVIIYDKSRSDKKGDRYLMNEVDG